MRRVGAKFGGGHRTERVVFVVDCQDDSAGDAQVVQYLLLPGRLFRVRGVGVGQGYRGRQWEVFSAGQCYRGSEQYRRVPAAGEGDQAWGFLQVS